jgi:hypothetical protein
MKLSNKLASIMSESKDPFGGFGDPRVSVINDAINKLFAKKEYWYLATKVTEFAQGNVPLYVKPSAKEKYDSGVANAFDADRFAKELSSLTDIDFEVTSKTGKEWGFLCLLSDMGAGRKVVKAYSDFNDMADQIKRKFGKNANHMFDLILDADDGKLRKMSLKDSDTDRLAYYKAWMTKAKEMTEDKEIKKPSLIEEIESILGGTTAVVNLVSPAVDNIEDAKSIISDEWVKKVSHLTDINNHIEAKLEAADLAKKLGNDKFLKIFDLISQLYKLAGESPNDLSKYEYSVSKDMRAYIKSKTSEEDYQKFMSAF